MKKGSVTVQDVLSGQVAEILPSKKGLESLLKKRKIRLYVGVDPTGATLHLGHMIVLRKLQQFADLGHEAILVVGTGTVLAGDPSQRAVARPKITKQEVADNIRTWKKQAAKVVDFSKVHIYKNGDWLAKLRVPEILNIASHISASRLFQRDMFQERLSRGDTVWTHEFLYPLLQGYDSFVLDVDLELGGTDQTFNMLVGRELQKKMRQKEKYVLSVPMLLGLDGKHMSKTSQNTVNVLDTPNDMYGKIMSLNDSLVEHYFELCTDVPKPAIQGLEPRDAKARLAKEIVWIYHGEKAAKKAEQEFERVFRRKETPSEITPVSLRAGPQGISATSMVVNAGLAVSAAEARRLIEQGGIRINGEVERDPNKIVHPKKGTVIQRGKRRFRKIT